MMLLRKELLEKAKNAPQSPGVYLMKGSGDEVLYAGKAKALRNRLSSYFQGEQHAHPRTEVLIQFIHDIEVIITASEAEALILESTLIKKYKPKFNVKLKDDKGYPYIKILLNEEYPRFQFCRKVQRDGARYFGPFLSSYIAKSILTSIHQVFQLRDCSNNTFLHRKRPCILYDMEYCQAPCVFKDKKLDYQKSITEAVQVLEGKSNVLMLALEEKLRIASGLEEFETAKAILQQIEHLKLLQSTQSVLDPNETSDKDIIGFCVEEGTGYAVILRIRAGRLTSMHQNILEACHIYQNVEDILAEFLYSHYQKTDKHKIASEPDSNNIIIPSSYPITELLSQATGLHFRHPKTQNDEQLSHVAWMNAQHALEQRKKQFGNHGLHACLEVQKHLKLKTLPQRIECYDISNFQGTDAVGSRVVFMQGAPEKSLYRRYKITSIQGANDFAMLREVFLRRFQNTQDPYPDLIVVDGGKGQLTQIVSILKEFGIYTIEVASLAKAKTQTNFQDRSIKKTDERIFLPNIKEPIILSRTTASFRLLTHLRDEAHRFALNYHKYLRDQIT